MGLQKRGRLNRTGAPIMIYKDIEPGRILLRSAQIRALKTITFVPNPNALTYVKSKQTTNFTDEIR